MNKKNCKDALDIYKKFLVRMDKVAEFLKTAEVRHLVIGHYQIFHKFSDTYTNTDQTLQTQIRLLLVEQSDQGLQYLSFPMLLWEVFFFYYYYLFWYHRLEA